MFWNKKPASSANKKNNDDQGDASKMGMLQRLAMKKLMKMDPKERERMIQKAMTPENIAKNKDKILETMEKMRESGQITEEQMKTAKEKLGL
ncbi:MAG: hypothetical protein WC831_05775 [Parcubacteria group bacterium]|jgi:hypothetical protein